MYIYIIKNYQHAIWEKDKTLKYYKKPPSAKDIYWKCDE